MGLGKRLSTGTTVFRVSFYMGAIASDLKQVYSVPSNDVRGLRKKVERLLKEMGALEGSYGVPERLVESHRELRRTAAECLSTLRSAELERPNATAEEVSQWMRAFSDAGRRWVQDISQMGDLGKDALKTLANTPLPQQASNAQPKFASMLATHFLGRQVEKKLVGSKFIRFGPLVFTGAFLFTQGAILGRAFRDRFDVFLVPYIAEEGRPEAAAYARELSQSMVTAASRADSLFEAVVFHEMAGDSSAAPDTWSSWLLSRSDERIPVDTAIQRGVTYGVMGAGFGAAFPAKVEELYEKSYSHAEDPQRWHLSFKFGVVDTPEPPDPEPLPEREAGVKEDLAEFCAAYYPELLTPLGLRAPTERERTEQETLP